MTYLDGRPVASVRDGDLLGLRDGEIEVWRSIPYARPPLGALRFRAPQPPPGWDGVRDAGPRSPAAIQPATDPGLPTSEDCLYLNVTAPAGRPAGLPVVVWLHGGGFRLGAGDDGIDHGRTLVTRQVVVVSVNYRLGALGFLHLGDRAPDAANCGILDQIAALEWVQRNIAGFGGDPGRVTVLGHSAGAKALGPLLAIPRSVALMRRAVSMSGGADFTNDVAEANELRTQFVRALGLADPNVAELQAVPPAEILAAQETLSRGVASTWTWRPTVDGRLLTRDPLTAIGDGSARGVDLLAGTVVDEARLFLMRHPASAAGATGVAERIFGTRAAQVLQAYSAPGDGSGGAAGERTAERFMTAERYLVPTIRLMEAQLRHATVFAYRFGSPRGGTLPQGHAADVALFWSTADADAADAADGPTALNALARSMHNAWAAFAHDGVPVDGALPPWPRYELGERMTMLLDAPATVVPDPDQDERLLWGDVTWRPGSWAG